MKKLLVIVTLVLGAITADAQTSQKEVRQRVPKKVTADSGVLMGQTDTIVHKQHLNTVKKAGVGKGTKKHTTKKPATDTTTM